MKPAEVPYATASNSANPGPGSYATPASGFLIALQRRLTDEPIGFSSTDSRPCMVAGAGGRNAPGGPGAGGYLDATPEDSTAATSAAATAAAAGGVPGMRAMAKSAPPGPGNYDLEPTSLRFQVGKRAAVGRHGIFGTCAARFCPGGLPSDVLHTDLYKVRAAQVATRTRVTSGLDVFDHERERERVYDGQSRERRECDGHIFTSRTTYIRWGGSHDDVPPRKAWTFFTTKSNGHLDMTRASPSPRSRGRAPARTSPSSSRRRARTRSAR